MTVVFPEGQAARGNDSVVFVPTMADYTAPKASEVNATAAVNISCWIDGFAPTADQSTGSDNRLCSKQTFETPGAVTVSIDALNYVYYPQADPAVPQADGKNKAYETMKQGTTGFLVDRRGLDARTSAVIAGQIVDVYPVTLGPQNRVAVDAGDDSGGKFKVSQKCFVTGPVQYDKKLAT